MPWKTVKVYRRYGEKYYLHFLGRNVSLEYGNKKVNNKEYILYVHRCFINLQ
jgi:hypothetical protein